MIIIDDSEELESLLQNIEKDSHVLAVPILADHQLHPSINKISCIYIYSSNEIEFIVPIHHTEQLTGFTELLHKVLSLESIFVHDKKLWIQISSIFFFSANITHINTFHTIYCRLRHRNIYF